MWFGILGPLEASRDGRPVAIHAPKQRSALATLLLRANQLVSFDQLIGSLWDEAAPVNARAAMQTHITRLRRTLGDQGSEHRLIHTRDQGYLIEIDAGSLDLLRFRELVDRATLAVGKGDVGRQADLLGEALALWRGPALDNVPSGSLHREEVPRLTETRLQLLEHWFDASLQLGRHGLIIGEIRAAAAAHPLRERLWGQLMLALHRCGRQAEALESFRTIDALLKEELGLDPGLELRRLQQAILNDDPVLTAPDVRPGLPAEREAEQVDVGEGTLPTPAELPADLTVFAGRQEETKLIGELFTSAGHDAVTVCAIAGPGGAGKSAMALHIAHRVADRYPDGQLYVNLHGASPEAEPLKPGEVLGRFLRSLGVPDAAIPVDVEEAAGRFRSMTDRKRLLVVLDNASSAAQVQPLLPGSHSCGVLITSRRILTSLDGAFRVQLGTLPEDEALALLTRLVGAARIDAEPGAAAELVTLCGGLPLAICIAAARLTARPAWPVAMLVERTAVERRRLSEFQVADRAVRASFAVSYCDLLSDRHGTAAARVFRLLGLLDSPDFDYRVAAALADVPDEEAEALLEHLVDAQLAETTALSRFRMHDLLHLFARERASEETTAQEQVVAVRRVLHFHLATARTALRVARSRSNLRLELGPRTLLHPGMPLETMTDVRAWLDTEADNLAAAVRQAGKMSADDVAVALASIVGMLLDDGGQWRRELVFAEAAVDAAEHSGDPQLKAMAYSDLGWVCSNLGQLDPAIEHLGRALRYFRQIGNVGREANQLDHLANAYRMQGRLDESIDHYLQALELQRRNGDGYGAGIVLSNLGLTYRSAGRHNEAIDAHEQAVSLIGDEELQVKASALGNLAETYRVAGHLDRACARFEEAIALERRAGMTGTYVEAEHLWGLGLVAQAMGDADGARKRAQEAARILHELGLITAADRKGIEESPVLRTPEVIERRR